MRIELSWTSADRHVGRKTYQRPKEAYHWAVKHPGTTICLNGRSINLVQLGRIVEAQSRLAKE